MATEDNLRDRAKEIRGAFEPSSVTNEAVGGLLLDIINFFIDYGGNGGGGGKPDARYWSKEELKMLDQYLYVLNDKIKALYADSAGDSELFKGHKWEDYFDQPVRQSDPVKFNSVTSPLFIFNELTTPEFVSGLLGAGTRLKDNHLELDEITVRKRMNVFELFIQRVRAVGGQLLLSPASIKISTVEELENGYKCSFNTDDQTIPEPFVLNDQAFHQTFTGKGINRYWRLTTEAGDDYFVLSKTDCEPGSGIPQPGDEVILLGNRTDKARQSAMMLSAYGNDAPYLDTYDGINDYNLSSKLLTREGNLTGIVDEVFGQLSGSGFYGKNVYLRGKFALSSGVSVDDKFGQTDSQMNNLQGQLTNQQGQLNTQHGQITNIQTDILAIPGQIKQEVSQTVTHEVGNLQIGMVNLLKGSNVELGAQAYNMGRYYYDKKPEVGKTYTLVTCYTLGEDNTSIGAYQDGGSYFISSFTTKGDRVVESKTFKYSTLSSPTMMIFYQFPHGTYGSKVHWAVLVEGNKGPNAWIPSLSEQGQEAAKDAIDNLQIGAVNLVSRKMMLAWNEKNKDIALWGQDSDGIYLGINQGALYTYVCGGSAHNDLFGGTIKYKDNTQYVFQVKWKLAGEQTNNNSGVSFWVLYTDGTTYGMRLGSLQTSLIIESFITEKGKTVEKIFSFYGDNKYRSLIYSLALYEGNKVLTEIPVATEDLQGQSNVNLVDGGKEVTVTAYPSTNNSYYKQLIVPLLKPNTVYHVSFKAENLAGNPTEYSAILFNKNVTTEYFALKSVSGGIMITPNNFVEGEARLLLYAGLIGSTAGNSVKFSEVMLVEGFTPPSSYSPSPGDVQKEIDDVSDAVTNLDTTINGAFKDGIIDEAEAKAIASNINILNAEKADIDAYYTKLYANAYLTGTAKTNLASAKTAYNTAHANLISSINTAIADGKATATEKADVDAKFSAYNNALSAYQTRVGEANKAIQDQIKALAEQDATNKVNGIQIGVRNLLLDSGGEVTNGSYNIKNYKTSIPLLPSKKYTVVIRGTTTGGQTLGLWFNGGSNGGGMFPSNMTDEVAFIHTTSPSVLNIKDYINFYNYPSSGSAANPATIKWACLYEGHVKPPMDWVQAPEDIDKAIQDSIAKTVDITAPSQVFKYGPGYTGTPTPSSIVLTATPRNFTPTSYQWQFLNGSTWINITIDGASSTYSVNPNSTTLFPSGTNVRTFRCICNGDEKLSDSFTLAKLADGATGQPGADGRGVKSTAVTYQSSTSGTTVPTGTWSASIPAVAAGSYLWTKTVITYTSGDPSTMYSVARMGTNGTNGNNGNGVSSTVITYQASTSGTTAPTGTWGSSIPSVSAGQYLWTRTVINYTNGSSSTIYSVGMTGKTGADGKDAYTILLGNESHAFAGSTAAALAGSTTCSVVAYKGATRVAATIGTISGLPTGMTASVASNGTTTPVITFTVTTSMTTASGTVNIPVTVDGKTFTKVFSYSIAFRGDPGESINGKMLYKDPEFKKGLNNVYKYTNSSNVDPDYIASKLTVERVTKPSDAPTQSGYCLKVTCKSAQTPGYGGVQQPITSRANAVFVQKIIAKIPVGYKINTASNSMGAGYSDTWLTPTEGTGKYTTYLRKVVCGATGTFSSGGHVYISGGPAPTESDPLEWYIAYMTAFDLTADGYGDIVEIAKTETVVGINNNPDSVTVYAKKTDFNSLNQVVNQQGSQLQVNTNSIDAIVTKNGSGTIVSIKPEMVEITGATVIKDGNGNKVNIFGIGDKVISVNGGVFSVDKAGKVIMQNAEIAGKITAKTGEIGSFTIDGIWLKGSELRISGSQITFENGNNQVYLNSHPDMATGGAVKLGTFVLTGGSYNGLESARAVALIAAAPSDNYSCAIAVTSGRVLMKGQIHFDNVVTYTGSGAVTITADSGHFIYLTPITGNPVVSVSSGLPIGSWFIIAHATTAGGFYYIKLSGSDRFRRRGNAYQQVNSNNQDPSLIFKVNNTTWVIGNLPVNWIDWN